MNTVESLKKLYKAMAGKDWPYDPNPTDAEVIDKIAADATGSGGGSGSARIIDLRTLDYRQEVDPESDEDIIHYFSGYEAGLSALDFINAWMIVLDMNGDLTPVMMIGIDDGFVSLRGNSWRYYYDPETGEFSYVQHGGNPK